MTELKDRDHVDVTIIHAPNWFDHKSDTYLLDLVTRFIAQDQPNLVLDLTSCSFIDSAAIGMVLKCMTDCKEAGGALKLLGPLPGKALRFFETAGLDKIFEIFDNESEAIQSYR